jgi:hypothetical protein
MLSRKADPHRMDRCHYACPYCEKGEAVFFGFDTQEERFFECGSCTRKLGETALKHAASERFLIAYAQSGDQAWSPPH